MSFWKKYVPAIAIGVCTVLLSVLVCTIAEGRSVHNELTSFIALADQARQTSSLPNTAFYPPFVIFLIMGLKGVGLKTVNPWVFNGFFFLAGTLLLYGFCLKLFSRRASLLVVAFALLNPLLAWYAMTSKDTAVEYLFSILQMFSLFLFIQESERTKSKWLLVIFVVSSCCSFLTRITGVFTMAALVVMAFLLVKEREKKKLMAIAAAACVSGVLLFMGYNKFTVGQFTLATNGGYNLYLGNHPLYIQGHPHYDIDVFMHDPLDTCGSADASTRSEMSSDACYRQQGIRFIRADPKGFVYRLLVKTVWHWFNLEKIPNFTQSATLTSADTITFGPVSLAYGLVYMAYKIIYLPLLMLGLYGLWRGDIEKKYGLFLAPLLGLWPVVVLTFPDTRFKVVAEILAIPFLWVSFQRMGKRRVD